MSKQLESKTCQFCHGILFEDDDVVVCPDCGAPYHRDCYAKLGHCALEQFHGTDMQYDIAEKRKLEQLAKKEDQKKQQSDAETICTSCGKTSSAKHDYCPHCGAAKKAREPHISPFGMPMYDSLGGVDKNAEIGNGVTAKEAGAFVGMKAYRYVPRFLANKKTSWNWAAFFVPQAWFAYRKMYTLMAIALVSFAVSVICTVPFYSELYAAISNLPIAETNAEQAIIMQQALSEAIKNAEAPSLLLFGVASLIDIATMVLSGLFGERAYRTKTITEITKIKQEENPEEPLRRIALKGGVNMFLSLFILMIITNSETLIQFILSFL